MPKIAVCIKQIPLVEDANFDPVSRTIRRDGVNVISAYDLRALAQAVDLKNRLGFETVAVTMGPPQAREALVDALGMGIDRAVHLQDRAFAGSDTLATARALAQWLKRESFDLILLGKYSLDAETGQVGPEIAELLGIAQITGVRKLELEGERILAERESDEGVEQVEARMPALLTCAERLINPLKIDAKTREAALFFGSRIATRNATSGRAITTVSRFIVRLPAPRRATEEWTRTPPTRRSFVCSPIAPDA